MESSASSSLSAVVAMATTATAEFVAPAQQPGTWTGFIGRLVLMLLHFVSSLLYWAIRLATITIPTLLFSLFSASWTVTMNATTL
jgi:lysophospholipid hydrolase